MTYLNSEQPRPDAVWVRPWLSGKLPIFNTVTSIVVPLLVIATLLDSLVSAVETGDRPVMIFMLLLTGLLLIPLAMGAKAAGSRLFGKYRGAAVAIDSSGVWWIAGGATTRLPWSHVAAITTVHGPANTRLRQHTYLLEVLPREPGLLSPSLRRWTRDAAPLSPGMPRERLSFRYSTSSCTGDVQQAVRLHAPHLWLARR